MISVVGNGLLAVHIEQSLLAQGLQVGRLHPDADGAESWQPEQLRQARVLVLASDDDAGNVDLALRIRRQFPNLPMVVRVFDAALASYLTETISQVCILSMSRVAAPVFAEAAQKVLAEQPLSSRVMPLRKNPVHQPYRVDRMLLLAMCSLLFLVFPSALIFAKVLHLRYIDALYFVWTTVMTVGYGDIALKDAPDIIKVFGMLLMLAGASFIAVLFAMLSDWVLNRRLDFLNGRTRVRGQGHALIVGAGNVGVRVAEQLAQQVRRVVIIEHDADSRNLALLKAAGHHVIIADATQHNTLDLAGIGNAALVLAVTDADAVNLQVALHARQYGVPVIMRMASPELSAHVSQRGDGLAFSPLTAAAQAFAQAAINLLPEA